MSHYKLIIKIVWIHMMTQTMGQAKHLQPNGGSISSTLILTHVVFRHGNRTAEPSELYPKDPYLNYTYFPFGRGQLTIEGKKKEYSIGKALRDKYGSFLGTYYYPEIVDAVSTNYNRTKMSLLLVLASLFPPKGVEIWKNDLNWQPVPYNYLSQSEDKVLLGTECNGYVTRYNQALASPKIQEEFQKYRDVFQYISQHTGLNVNSTKDVYKLFFGLSTEEEWGFRLPVWTKKVWPETIINLSVREYYVSTATTDLKRLASGYHIKKIIDDTQKKIKREKEENGVKMYLYSAHENNLAQLLILLNIKVDHVPTYGSYIVFEIHRMNKTHGVKIYYQNYLSNNIKLLKLPACEELCPLEKFKSLVSEYIPTGDLCNN